MVTCPKCHTQINNPKAHFCYSCGSRLEVSKTPVQEYEEKIESIKDQTVKSSATPSTDVKNTSSFSISKGSEKGAHTETSNNDSISKRWNYFIVGVNALSVLFLIVALGFFFRANQYSLGEKALPVVEINKLVVENAGDLQLEEVVLKSDYQSIVPREAKLYIEASNLEVAVPTYIGESNTKYFEETFELEFLDLLVFMKKDYAFVKTETDNYAFIFSVGGFDFFERAYSKYQENKSQSAEVFAKRVGEFFVISNSEELIKSMDGVVAGVSVSISSEPNFTRSITQAQRPLFFVYASSKEYFDLFSNEYLNELSLDGLVPTTTNYVDTLSFYVEKQANDYLIVPIKNE